MNNLKKTPLYEEHIKSGAKIVPFAGWAMPVQYESIIEEHNTVRNNAGLFDVSHMGKIFISGRDSVKFLQSLVPQDISKLANGKAVYCQLTNDDAGIIDDLIIYKINCKNDNTFLLIINASRINEDLKWFEENRRSFDINIENKSDQLAIIAVQGPLAKDLINDAGISCNDQPQRFSIKMFNHNSYNICVARTGYTGEDGFEILTENGNAAYLWRELLEKGEKYGVKPIGLGARDTLRLEAAMLLYGQDIDTGTTPVEASLSWSIAKDKTDNYYGKNKILSQLSGKNLEKVLVGFKMLDKSIPRHNYEIYKNGEKVGEVTSGGVAPAIQANIGLGYINASCQASAGTRIDVKIRERLHPAEITKRPFYKHL